ncbi:hypothetical protein Bpla01_11100 [Burkholderia plantarii]|nr:hypothetical protein Bpla01_11100 [Burkholderia plantarii]
MVEIIRPSGVRRSPELTGKPPSISRIYAARAAATRGGPGRRLRDFPRVAPAGTARPARAPGDEKKARGAGFEVNEHALMRVNCDYSGRTAQ